MSSHRVASGLLVALTALLLAGAAVTGYLDRVLFDGDRFAARTTTALRDPDVRTVIADRVTDQLVLRNRPDLLAGAAADRGRGLRPRRRRGVRDDPARGGARRAPRGVRPRRRTR